MPAMAPAAQPIGEYIWFLSYHWLLIVISSSSNMAFTSVEALGSHKKKDRTQCENW